MPAGNRHLARQIVIQTIFEWEFRENDPQKILHYWLKEFVSKNLDSVFAETLFEIILDNLVEIKKQITCHAPKWPLEKISGLERACLYVGIAELLYFKKIPPKVIINEAVEITKEFGGDASFINAVLAAVWEERKRK